MSKLKDTIYINTNYYFKDRNGNYIFPNWNKETQLLALCLEEFYDIKRSKIFYENKGKIFDIENNKIIGWSINGSPIKSER